MDNPLETLTRQKILIIGHEDKQSLAVVEGLLAAHFEVDIQLVDDSAVETVAKGHYDMVIVDLMLPHYAGFKVVRLLRIADETKRIPVLVLIDYGSNDYMQVGLNLGASDVVIKNPTMVETVVGLARKHLVDFKARSNMHME